YLEDHSADPYRAVAEADQEDRDLDSLRNAMTQLDARAQDIIRRRWLDDASKVTLQDLADEYGVSAERIRQIEASALKKMRASFAA
ncbi:RNA polymerase factor sigma-32, partial [mine drainage metagenome]